MVKCWETLLKFDLIPNMTASCCNPGGLYSSKCSSEIGYSTTRRESTTEEGQQTVQDNYLRRKCKHLATSHGITTSHSH